MTNDYLKRPPLGALQNSDGFKVSQGADGKFYVSNDNVIVSPALETMAEAWKWVDKNTSDTNFSRDISGWNL